MNGDELIQKAYDAILANDFELAVERFEQAITLEPSNSSYHYKLSVTCLRSGYVAKSLQSAEQALKLEPENATYQGQVRLVKACRLQQLAKECLKRRRPAPEEAIGLLNQALVLDPLSIEGYMLLGIAQASIRNYMEAVVAIQELLKLDPQHADGALLLAEYQRKLRDA